MVLIRRRKYVNLPMLGRVIGLLLVIEAGFMLIPFITSLCFSDGESLSFLISIGITLAAGSLLMFQRPRNREMGKREAVLMTSLIWVILSLFGMIPFLLSHTHYSIVDAYFETMSGYTTTGVSVLPTLDGVPKSILIWRCVTQWIGGMGIILFTLAVVPMLNSQGGIQLFNAEVTGITHDKLRPRVSNTARSLWGIYIVLTIVMTLMLGFTEMGFFDSFCHALSIVSTGGFSTHDDYITVWDNNLYIKSVVTTFMFLGGVSFALMYKATQRKFRSIWANTAFRWYLGLIGVSYVVLCAARISVGSVANVEDLTIDPLFQAVGIISSTGITEGDFFEWGPIAVMFIILIMGIGGCAGSTSGGAKVDRIVVLYQFIKNQFYQMMHPSAVTTVVINGKGTSTQLVQRTLGFLFIYVAVILIAGLLFVVFGMNPHVSFLCALECISNAGAGASSLGLEGGYAMLPPACKWVMCLVMLIGRLELYTVLLLFTRVFWRR